MSHLRRAVAEDTIVKLTLGNYRGGESGLKNLFVRPVNLKAGRQLSFIYRYATRDLTKNFPAAEALPLLERLTAADFGDAHLFTPAQQFQLLTKPDGSRRLKVSTASSAPALTTESHDREKGHLIPADAAWLRALGVCNDRGHPREGMAGKFRQINKFVELLSHLVAESALADREKFLLYDMGCGKGYLTFAAAHHFGRRADIVGIEARPELPQLCNQLAQTSGLNQLTFQAGTIEGTELPNGIDVLIALHACDTATDEAIAKGIQGGATLIVVSPCCQKELRPQLSAPPVLAEAWKHGIFQERQAEFVTDALRAMLLEWTGYRTKVFEFVSTEHTQKNLMIAAVKTRPAGSPEQAARIRLFAQFYGAREQRLARLLGVTLSD